MRRRERKVSIGSAFFGDPDFDPGGSAGVCDDHCFSQR
jgi:hypothetical protein